MAVFTLLEQVSEKAPELPRNTVKNTLIISQSILHSGTVNLNKVKDMVPHVREKTDRTVHADYKFLTRYFDQGNLVNEQAAKQYEELMECIRSLCFLVLFQQTKAIKIKQVKHLLLDGTKWDNGQQTIHLMTLCVLVADVAIPIWWEDIAKAGHSSQKERIAALQAALKSYQLQGMILLADREYLGLKWFKFLSNSGLYFVIRLKEQVYHDYINAGKGRTWEQLKKIASKKVAGKKVAKRIWIDGLQLYYIILKNPRPKAEDELIYLITNWKSPAQAAKMYEWRWQIEVCFKHLKTNGLRLEDMNVQGKYKRHLMMAVAVLVYILAIREGLIAEAKKAVRWSFDKASGFHYRAVSIFLKGLPILKRKALSLNQFYRYLNKITHGKFGEYYLIV